LPLLYENGSPLTPTRDFPLGPASLPPDLHYRLMLRALAMVRHSGGSRICQGEDHGERGEREPKRESGGGDPAWCRGRDIGRGQGAKLKAFCPFSYKKVAKT